jgi:DNA-binding MarR family transcriptional regulator
MTGESNGKSRLRLWLRLLTCSGLVERAVRRRLRQEFAATLPRFDLMAALDRSPAGLTMGELSVRLKVSNGNVTGVVERLVRERLVERTALPTDRRSYRVALTAAGRTAFATMAARHADWIDRLLGDLSDGEIEQLMGLLGRLRRTVETNSLEARS